MPRARGVYDAFRLSYGLRYPNETTDLSGMGAAYDATYAAAFALASGERPVTGHAVAAGLRSLWGGTTEIELQESSVLAAFARLAGGESISAIGTQGPLAWDSAGVILGSALELWCIGRHAGTLSFASAGLTLDLATGRIAGRYEPCP